MEEVWIHGGQNVSWMREMKKLRFTFIGKNSQSNDERLIAVIA